MHQLALTSCNGRVSFAPVGSIMTRRCAPGPPHPKVVGGLTRSRQESGYSRSTCGWALP